VDKHGNIIVSGFFKNRIRIFNENGDQIQKIGGKKKYGNVEFSHPFGVDVFDGRIYVADKLNHRIQVFDENGKFLSAFGSKGSKDGDFDNPTGIAIDGEGKIIVADMNNFRIQIFDKDFKFLTKYPCVSPRFLCLDDCGNIMYTQYSKNHLTIVHTGFV